MLIVGKLYDSADAIPELGWLRVDAGRIVERGFGAAPSSGAGPGAADLGHEDALITPGFIDAHVHLPQLNAVGCCAGDLLEWLDTVIYPAEQAWADPEFARTALDAALQRFAASGTLGFAGYLTAHPHPVALLDEALSRVPLRAIAGQVLMNRGGPAELLGQPLAPPPPDRDRFEWSVNPRFAVACDAPLLARAGELAAEGPRAGPGAGAGEGSDAAERSGGPSGGRMIQTHLAEQTAELELVRTLFPEAPHYTAVYDDHQLLGPRTLLAHSVHLSESEWELIARRGAVVVHCPGANTFLSSGLFDLAAARHAGVRLALGSDLAAGPDLAMPRVARAMIEVATLRRLTVDPATPVPTPAEAWTQITRGNAEALGWNDSGRLTIGACADLLVIETPFPLDDAFLAGRLLYTWRERYIRHRIVNGKVLTPPVGAPRA